LTTQVQLSEWYVGAVVTERALFSWTASAGVNVSAIALGSYFSCALGKDRLVRCWGKNQVGQLGIGSVETVGTGGMGTSIQTVNIGSDGMKLNFSRLEVVLILSSTGALAVTTGYEHACALRVDSKVVCWGGNQYGQLGVGSTTDVGTATGQMGVNLAVAAGGQ
jgi:alpha-tubulin suppressor-like RCC1 family protein